jgi:hypothetical protein
MDLGKIFSTLQSVTETAESVAGPAAALGIPYAGLVKAGLDVARNIEQRVADGVVVASSDDRAKVKQIIADLETANDALAAAIDES